MVKTETGKVIKSTRNTYLVDVKGETLSCSVRGKLIGKHSKKAVSVKVGDDVLIRKTSLQNGIIEKILDRHSKFSRAIEGKAYREHIIATNIDQVIVVMSTRRPSFKSGLLDRYLVIAEKNKLQAQICINKIDLAPRDEFDCYNQWYPEIGYPLFFTSAKNGNGLDDIISILQNKTSILVGQSGVGKSSLIQRIQPDLNLKIGTPSPRTKKGVHTTAFVQLFPLTFGGYIVDTPGVRELGLWGVYKNDLKEFFIDFSVHARNCQFKNCSHLSEPGCAVKNALETENIFRERYLNYKNIYADLRAAPHELIKFR